MKRFDFSQTGGFPASQDRLAWMQAGYIEAINSLATLAGSAVPCVITGVELTSGSWATGGVISDGWVYSPDWGVVPFVGGAFTPTSNVVIWEDSFPTPPDPLIFENNAGNNVQILRRARIGPGVTNTLQTLSQTRWQQVFGATQRTEWTALTLLTGISANLNYMQDTLTGMVRIRGNISVHPSGTGSNPFPYIACALVPNSLAPAQEIYFPTQLDTIAYDAINEYPHISSTGKIIPLTFMVVGVPPIYAQYSLLYVRDVASGLTVGGSLPNYNQFIDFSYKL